LLPAAAIRTAFFATAYAIAWSSVALPAGPPRLMLITRAPASAARTIPLASVAMSPAPSSPSTFTGRIEHVQQIPATPAALLLRAAMMPATDVPWPWTSFAFVVFPTTS
jgi:hypothetical protein